MNNFEMFFRLVDGSEQDIYYGETSGKELIHDLVTDDFGAPPRVMCIQVETESGKKVRINIPYDEVGNASVFVDNEAL